MNSTNPTTAQMLAADVQRVCADMATIISKAAEHFPGQPWLTSGTAQIEAGLMVIAAGLQGHAAVLAEQQP